MVSTRGFAPSSRVPNASPFRPSVGRKVLPCVSDAGSPSNTLRDSVTNALSSDRLTSPVPVPCQHGIAEALPTAVAMMPDTPPSPPEISAAGAGIATSVARWYTCADGNAVTGEMIVGTAPRPVADACRATGGKSCPTRGAGSSLQVAHQTRPSSMCDWHLRHLRRGSSMGRSWARPHSELAVSDVLGSPSDSACQVALLAVCKEQEGASDIHSVCGTDEGRPLTHSTSTKIAP